MKKFTVDGCEKLVVVVGNIAHGILSNGQPTGHQYQVSEDGSTVRVWSDEKCQPVLVVLENVEEVAA